MTPAEVKKLLGWTLANFPGQQERNIGPTAELWLKMLADLPYPVAEAALIKVLAKARFFPTVAEIREAAMSLWEEVLPLPAEAWAEVTKLMRDVGQYRTPEYSHPLISKAVDAMGGWVSLCKSEEAMADRAHFLKIFETYRTREAEETNVAPLIKQLMGGIAKELPKGVTRDELQRISVCCDEDCK